ncbi:uncharacterized protein LOC131995384 isoform X1 [Stomoxys calcitrans]|uniref:uncharacterized protein LOC131995384 isoform X1 n=1 Tax=Stomoxys calcitrans TaxID=35570 RepID=UPI0027E33FE2|nr:uncharacterized protein LOC131995384 isoform X1 [Stomoxys calcitrans]
MVLSRRESSSQRRSQPRDKRESRRSPIRAQISKPNVYKCTLCNRFHALKICPKFIAMTPKERNILVLKKIYCVNCLARSHRFRDCRSGNMCRKCGRPHHTLLHPNYVKAPNMDHKRQPVSPKGSNSNNHRNKSDVRENIHRQRCHRRNINIKPNNNNSNNKIQTDDTANTNSPAKANQQILSEAIRALASVLCSNTN